MVAPIRLLIVLVPALEVRIWLVMITRGAGMLCRVNPPVQVCRCLVKIGPVKALP